MNQRTLFPDFLKSIAIFGVVLIHVSAGYMYSLTEQNKTDFITAMLLNFFFLWSVPIFTMISGMFLLRDSDEKISTFFKKRVTKVLIPFFTWSIIYYIYTGYFNLHPLTVNKETLIGFIKGLFTNKIFFHLWFVYMIMMMYVLTPVIRVVLKRISIRISMTIIILLFSLIFTTNLISFILGYNFRTWNLTFSFLPFSQYLFFIGYFILGYYLLKLNFSKIQKRVIYLLGFISYTILISGTYFFTKNNEGILFTDFSYYLHPPVFIISIAVFVFSKDHFNKQSNTFFMRLSDYSYQVYLMHMLILNLFIIFFRDTYIFVQLSRHALVYIVVMTMLTFVTSNLIAWAIKKTPLLNRVM